jgi:AcrR family transcriptional regulator
MVIRLIVKESRYMARQNEGASTRQQDVSRREERAHRILDAAATLILRWGYNKTTIDDIARQAGVAKGTIYLHWKTREELFRALLQRERLALTADVKQRITSDPAGATLRGLLKHSTLALMQRPLLKAILLRDMDVIGKLAHSQQSNAAYAERLAGFTTYLEFLREHNLVRTDLNLRAQLYMVSAIFMGFFLIAPLMPDELKLSDEEIADLLAETVHRTLESDRTIDTDELPALSHALLQYMNRDMASVQEQFQQALET